MKKAITIVVLTFPLVTFLTATGQERDPEKLKGKLNFAIISDDIDQAKEAIEAGVDINYKFDLGKSHGFTPLVLAVSVGNAEMAKLLIDAGADINVAPDGLSLLHIAPLFATDSTATAVIELLIAKGLDVNVKGTAESRAEIKGATSLHVAAGKGKVAAAMLLISKGAEVNARTKSGHTPLDLAIINGMEELADSLRQHRGISGKK